MAARKQWLKDALGEALAHVEPKTVKSIDPATLETESPTTNSWFDAAHILGRSGKDWDDFRDRLAAVVGIPLDS